MSNIANPNFSSEPVLPGTQGQHFLPRRKVCECCESSIQARPMASIPPMSRYSTSIAQAPASPVASSSLTSRRASPMACAAKPTATFGVVAAGADFGHQRCARSCARWNIIGLPAHTRSHCQSGFWRYETQSIVHDRQQVDLRDLCQCRRRRAFVSKVT